MAKYGIKHISGVVSAISVFNNDIVGVGFTEITKAKYDEFLAAFLTNPFITYDTVKNEIAKDAIELSNSQNLQVKAQVRLQLLVLSNELDLMVRMGETTTSIQSDFDALKSTYEAL